MFDGERTPRQRTWAHQAWPATSARQPQHALLGAPRRRSPAPTDCEATSRAAVPLFAPPAPDGWAADAGDFDSGCASGSPAGVAAAAAALAPLAAAVVGALRSAFVVAALARNVQLAALGVGGGLFARPVPEALAGVLALAARARLAPRELGTSTVLAALWIQESTDSQLYASELSSVLLRYTFLAADPRGAARALRPAMPAAQRALLHRSGWARLRRGRDVAPALAALAAAPGFDHVVAHVHAEAARCAPAPARLPPLLPRVKLEPGECWAEARLELEPPPRPTSACAHSCVRAAATAQRRQRPPAPAGRARGGAEQRALVSALNGAYWSF